MAVIGALDATHARLTLTRATARRSLHTSRALAYAACGDGTWFERTAKVLDHGYAYRASLQVGDIARPRPTPGPRRTPDEMRSIAAPRRDRNGRAVAAMNASTTVSPVTKARLLEQFLPALVETVAATSAQLAKR